MPRLPIEPADRARLDQLGELYAACRTAYEGLAEDTAWRCAPGSRAQADRRQLTDYGTAVSIAGPDAISAVTHWYLYGAASHMGALSVLFERGEVLLSPALLIRSVLEFCAHILWVLGDLGREPFEQRLARAYLEGLVSVEEAKKTSGRLLAPDSEERVRRRNIHRELKREAHQLFAEPHVDARGRPMLSGIVMPGLQGSVVQMLVEHLGLDDRSAMGVYDHLSNRAHPTMYQLMAIWARGTTESGPEVMLLRTGETHGKDARVAVLAFYHALSYVMLYHGWPPGRQQELTQAIDRLLPGALSPAPTAPET